MRHREALLLWKGRGQGGQRLSCDLNNTPVPQLNPQKGELHPQLNMHRKLSITIDIGRFVREGFVLDLSQPARLQVITHHQDLLLTYTSFADRKPLV